MDTLLQFIARLSVVLYALAATGIFFSFRALVQARRRRRIAAFGLEREAATAQFRRALSTMLTLALLAGLVYVVENVILPNRAASEVAEEESTPVVFVTSEPTPTGALLLYPTVTPTAGIPPAEAEEAENTPEGDTAAADLPADGCEIIGANFSSPAAGETVSGQVRVEGEVNVLNFSLYKFEVRGPSTGEEWAVVGTYYEPVQGGLLGVWDSTSLMPGSYSLRLVVHRQDGTTIPPCEVPITVERAGAGGL